MKTVFLTKLAVPLICILMFFCLGHWSGYGDDCVWTVTPTHQFIDWGPDVKVPSAFTPFWNATATRFGLTGVNMEGMISCRSIGLLMYPSSQTISWQLLNRIPPLPIQTVQAIYS